MYATASPAGSTAGRKKAGGRPTAKPVKNVELWQQLDSLAGKFDIDWRWVKGHAGDPGNERADELANMGAAQFAE